jgi:hypothetical protein
VFKVKKFLLIVIAVAIVFTLHFINKGRINKVTPAVNKKQQLVEVIQPKIKNEVRAENFSAYFDGNNMKIVNNSNNKNISKYAWYITNAKTRNVYKEDYSSKNEFEYKLDGKSNYYLTGYEIYNDGTRDSSDFAVAALKNGKYECEYKKDENIFDSTSFKITNVDDSSFKFANNFKTDDDISYAWYIIDADTKTTIDKITYSKHNELDYTFKSGKNYIVRGYIKGEKTEATGVDFVKINKK